MIKGLATVIYHVRDIHRAKAWYAAAFQQAPYFDQPFYVGFNIGGYELGLTPIPRAHRRARAEPSRTGASTLSMMRSGSSWLPEQRSSRRRTTWVRGSRSGRSPTRSGTSSA